LGKRKDTDKWAAGGMAVDGTPLHCTSCVFRAAVAKRRAGNGWQFQQCLLQDKVACGILFAKAQWVEM